jgi:hypothetical protein
MLVGKLEGKRPLGRPRLRWESNIKLELREIEWDVWAGSIWLRIGISGGLLCELGNEPTGSIKY